MESLDYWRLCDELSVIQAALLIVDRDPSEVQEYIQRYTPENRPPGYDAAFAALKHAILAKRLPAHIRREAWERGWNEEPSETQGIERDASGRQFVFEIDPSWEKTTVTVEDLRTWLRSRGISSGFFFPDSEESSVPYLNPRHPNFSPKLSAAVHAWEALTNDPSLLKGTTAKQALIIWLRRNADRLDLSREDGTPSGLGIGEIAKVVNWDTKGGAPKTPTGK